MNRTCPISRRRLLSDSDGTLYVIEAAQAACDVFSAPGRDPAVVNKQPLEYRRLMTPVTALDKQIERYRQMTGEQRLAVALELHELSCEIAREGIRRANPAADAAEVEQLLHRRLQLGRAE